MKTLLLLFSITLITVNSYAGVDFSGRSDKAMAVRQETIITLFPFVVERIEIVFNDLIHSDSQHTFDVLDYFLENAYMVKEGFEEVNLNAIRPYEKSMEDFYKFRGEMIAKLQDLKPHLTLDRDTKRIEMMQEMLRRIDNGEIKLMRADMNNLVKMVFPELRAGEIEKSYFDFLRIAHALIEVKGNATDYIVSSRQEGNYIRIEYSDSFGARDTKIAEHIVVAHGGEITTSIDEARFKAQVRLPINPINIEKSWYPGGLDRAMTATPLEQVKKQIRRKYIDLLTPTIREAEDERLRFRKMGSMEQYRKLDGMIIKIQESTGKYADALENEGNIEDIFNEAKGVAEGFFNFGKEHDLEDLQMEAFKLNVLLTELIRQGNWTLSEVGSTVYTGSYPVTD